MISQFFIHRPVFAFVLSILITFIGLTALFSLPIEQYPNMTPPLILVQTNYRGADAETIAQTVAAPLEQEINGVENMIYMYSQNSSSGNMSLSVFFEIGTDINRAQIDVQNKVNIVLSKLPQEVQREGITIKKQTPNILLIVAVSSPEGQYDDIFINNYANINIANELKRVPGISSVDIIGAREYAMRIWLNPDKMAQLHLTTEDIYRAIKEQNQQFALGRIGQPPMPSPAVLTVPVITLGRFDDAAEFENIILRANSDGSMILLKDIAKVDLGAQTYDVVGELNGKPTTLIAIYQQYGANALGVSEAVKKRMKEISETFPQGISYSTPYDTTIFVKRSINEVFMTFLEAGVLVALVIFIFLQNFRATLIPIVAMVVSIIGTFAGMYALGFSLNTLTLFGLVLAIGIVVDDAIVVIENVERNLRGNKLSPIEAATKAMHEVTGPIIATTLVLCAVFIPIAFLGGISGQLYKQFAITISISVLISGFVALTLSPVMAILLVKVAEKGRFGKWFDIGFDKITSFYIAGSTWLIDRPYKGILLFMTCMGFIGLLLYTVPSSFVPNEDQGYVFAIANLPENSSQDRMLQLDRTLSTIALENPYVENVVSLSGFSFLEGMPISSSGSNFFVLKDWDLRTKNSGSIRAILTDLYAKYYPIPEGEILMFNPPPIQGVGAVGGFEFWIEDRSSGNLRELERVVQQFIKAINERPEINHVTTAFQTNSLQIFVDLDRPKARALGVDIDVIFQTLQTLLGTVYVNDFNKYGRVFRVMLQAEPAYRSKIEDIGATYVRSKNNEMIPLSAMVDVKFQKGPSLVSRFNGFNAARLIGEPAPGYTSGEAMNALKEVSKIALPQGISFSWGGLSYQEQKAQGAGAKILLAGIFMVFLILAALYERWLIPFSIILAVPFGILGALLAVWLVGMSNDVYFQISLVTLIGLAAKNAILIVEFALEKRAEGLSLKKAALEATKIRFRAIMMTSLTMIMGVLPLILSRGAGAASRKSVGMGMFGGMITATFLAILFVPLFYFLFSKITEKEESQ